MYVPNYIPEPLEVPANVTFAPYRARVRFIKRVTALHLVSLTLLASYASAVSASPNWFLPAMVLLSLFLLLDLGRILLRGKPVEALLSSLSLRIVLVSAAWLGSSLASAGVPVEFVLAGPAACGIYTLCCGRDYSFVGCFLLSLILSSTVLAAIAIQLRMRAGLAACGLGLNAAYLTYFVYDLASLMARRREGEELAAVVDLYRDVLNVFGYLVRVVGHWKRHRIWVPPK